MKSKISNNRIADRSLIRYMIATAVILSIPLIAMKFTEEVDWKLGDFIIIGTLLMGTGMTFELLARKLKTSLQRTILAAILSGLLFLTWVELAVGIFGTPFAGS